MRLRVRKPVRCCFVVLTVQGRVSQTINCNVQMRAGCPCRWSGCCAERNGKGRGGARRGEVVLEPSCVLDDLTGAGVVRRRNALVCLLSFRRCRSGSAQWQGPRLVHPAGASSKLPCSKREARRGAVQRVRRACATCFTGSRGAQRNTRNGFTYYFASKRCKLWLKVKSRNSRSMRRILVPQQASWSRPARQ